MPNTDEEYDRLIAKLKMSPEEYKLYDALMADYCPKESMYLLKNCFSIRSGKFAFTNQRNLSDHMKVLMKWHNSSRGHLHG